MMSRPSDRSLLVGGQHGGRRSRRTVPPATPRIVWAALYVLAGVAGAMRRFSRRDL
jgi:hypothetical protein